MAGTDDLIARLRADAQYARMYGAPEDGVILREAATALAERDATIERLKKERDSAVAELDRIRDAIAVKGGNEHAPTEWAYKAACAAWQKRLDLHRAAEARAITAERERDEARAEVERLNKLWNRSDNGEKHG